MTSKPSDQHLADFVTHVISTLPDGLKLRKTVLVTLHSTLPAGTIHRQAVRTLIESLRTHEKAQMEFTDLIHPIEPS